MSGNFYIELNLFLDPAITDTVALKAELDKKIAEWNKLINTDTKYKHFVQIARAWKNNLNNCDLTTLAAEARLIREQQGKEAVDVYEENGILELKAYDDLHKEFSPFFTETTIDSWLHLKVSESFIPPEPHYPSEVKKKILSKDDMDKIANDLKIILGNEKASLYDLIGVSPTSNLKTIQEKRQSAYDAAFKKPKTGSDSAKVDAENRLLGRAKTIFDTDVSRQGYDIALKRRPFDKLIDSKFKRRAIKGSITYEDYQRSIKETLELGFSQTETDWYVYNYYCNTRKLPFPKPVKIPIPSSVVPVPSPKPVQIPIPSSVVPVPSPVPEQRRLFIDPSINSIFDAIEKDSFKAVKIFVENDKTLVNKTDENGATPLHWAA
ncbi:MAG: ankyrin repeat domain-containing protein, partial [Planctomycetaceae bacterium]|nr:ankyrin repeat domain-containing protein [Planctomycetaceae bacterium]